MLIEHLPIQGPFTLTPKVFVDNRGHFLESYNESDFSKITSLKHSFVQDNESKSLKNVLRGMHYQLNNPQAKLVRVVEGKIFDVAVDIRRSSKNFGKWVAVELCSEKKKQFYVPVGFAHGFLVLSDMAIVQYKTTSLYDPNSERCFRWNCKKVRIEWPMNRPILSNKDASAPDLSINEAFP